MIIETRHESRRKCGYRHAGKEGYGLYLVGGPLGESCERLPYPTITCPCCGEGFKYSRSMRRIDAAKLFQGAPWCQAHGLDWGLEKVKIGEHFHDGCPMCSPERMAPSAFLMWVGRQYYSPPEFTREAQERGASRRVAQLPRGFVPGESWVYLAHLDAIPPWSWRHPEYAGENGTPGTDRKPAPGVFSVFRPRLEVVVDTENPAEVPQYVHELAGRWGEQCSVVRVIPERELEQASLPEEE